MIEAPEPPASQLSDPSHETVVRRSFERQASLFAESNSLFARGSGNNAWIEPLHPEMIVLDVACGAGHAAETLAPLVRQVVGLDLTLSLLELGADRLRSKGVPNVLFQAGNAEALPFVDGSFDVVFCRSSLHHFSHPETAVSEMVRTCRPGGRVVLVDIVPPDATVRDAFDHVHRLIDPSHVRSFLEPELADLLPGGIGALTYADTFSLRLPVDVAFTEQSESATVLDLLRREIAGTGNRTGFDPADQDGTVVVTFTTSVVHAARP